MQQLTGLWQSARATGTIAQAYSAEAQMAYVDYREVAELAAQAFVSDRFSYGTFELGPRISGTSPWRTPSRGG